MYVMQPTVATNHHEIMALSARVDQLTETVQRLADFIGFQTATEQPWQ